MFDDPNDYITPDGLPMPKSPTIRLIFASQEDKNKFLAMLSDGKLPNVEIGASESEPLFEVDDVSVIVYE